MTGLANKSVQTLPPPANFRYDALKDAAEKSRLPRLSS